MNLLKAVYCNQYYELKPTGKAEAARKSGTGLLTVALVLLFFACMAVLFIVFPDFADFIGDTIDDIFGRQSGRTVGKIIGLFPFLVIYPLVNFTLGSEKKYKEMIDRFEALPKTEQEQISKKGMWFFIASLGSIVISLGYFLF